MKYKPKEAATKIQSYYRMHLQSHKYLLMRNRNRKHVLIKKKFLRLQALKSGENEGEEKEHSTAIYHVVIYLLPYERQINFYVIEIENKYKHDGHITIDHLPLLQYEKITCHFNKKMIVDFVENLLVTLFIHDYELKFQQGMLFSSTLTNYCIISYS